MAVAEQKLGRVRPGRTVDTLAVCCHSSAGDALVWRRFVCTVILRAPSVGAMFAVIINRNGDTAGRARGGRTMAIHIRVASARPALDGYGGFFLLLSRFRRS